ncbi:MAG: hypothetical protein ACUVQ0_03920 [Thermoproteota archaeon]
MASMKGFIVQADFPLIGSYPALDRSPYYSESVKMQLIEFMLLTYNYPSIVIVCPHTLPSWVNERSPYSRSRANYQLVFELEDLARSINGNVIILPYSGEYDMFIEYLFPSDGRITYNRYERRVLNVIGPTGLPCLNSDFWNYVPTSSYEETMRFLNDKGFDLNISSLSWLNTPLNLSSIVKLSQEHQSLAIRYAIDRVRILKNSFSMGIILMPLTDYLPEVTGSIIDYYGFEKQAYYEVKRAFNPIHTVILIEGDYRSNLTSLYFLPNSTVRINLWIVNDAFRSPVDAVLNWSLIDLTSNKAILSEENELKLPSSSSGAVLVKTYFFEVPYYTDVEHVLEVSTELRLKNGTKLDANSQSFIAEPISFLRVSLDSNVSKPQTFLISTGDNYIFTQVLNETVIAVPSNVEVTVIGPSLKGGDVYVPEFFMVGRLSAGEVRDVRITLYPGAVAKVLATLPSLNASISTKQEIYVNLTGEILPNLVLEYTSQRIYALSLLNITGNTIIVPAEKNLTITVSLSSNQGKIMFKIGDEEQPINLQKNSYTYFDQAAIAQVELNQPIVDRAINSAEKAVKEASKNGFYMGLDRN